MDQILPFLAQHWGLTSAFVFILILLLVTGKTTHVRGVHLLTADELVTLMNHEKTMVVDIRSQEAFKQSHILHARSIPEDQLESQAAQFDKTKPLVIVGQTEAVALRLASTVVKQHQCQRVYCLRGGISTWRDANLPLTKK